MIVVTDTNLGGITTAAYNLASVLVNAGHTVDFLDMSGEYQNETGLHPSVNRLVLRGKSRYWNITLTNNGGLGKISHKLLGCIKKVTIKSDLWYRMIFSKLNPSAVYDAALAFRQCAPCYSFVLNKVNAKKKIGFIHGEKKYMGDISSWDKYFSKLDHIACVSDYVRREFSEVYPQLPNKFCCVYNTFDIQNIRKKAEEKPDIEYDKNKINFVTVARINNAVKRLQFIPEICRQLKDEALENFCWYVVGDGPDLEECKAYAKQLGVEDCAVFIGRKNNPFPYVAAADMLVLCSVSEAYAMTVKEAHILRIPVLSADYATAYEAVEDGVDGYIVNGTPEVLADKLEWLLANGGKELTEIQNFTKQKQVTNELAYSQLMSIVSS